MLRLLCFGYPRLEGPDGRNLEEFQSHPKPFAVLIYLACHSEVRVCQRDSLLPVFWPEADESHARNSLRQTLHVLRTLLGEDILQSGTGGEVRLDDDRLTSDVRLFCEAFERGSLADALALRAEPFLQDFFVSDATPFMDWADQRRRFLRLKAADAATRLARKADEDRYPDQAIAWWRRALELSPYDEGVMASLVWALARSGNGGDALAEYQRFRDRMERELQLQLSDTTRAAVDQALRIAGSARARSPRMRPARDPGGQDRAGTWSRRTDAVPGFPGD